MVQPRPKIGIVGYGIVGQALAYGFSGADIHIYDKYKQKKGFDTLPEVARHSEFIFICLPTPAKGKDGSIDLSIIEKNIAQLSRFTSGTGKIIVIKSTVIPGTTLSFIKKYPKGLFAFNPEFLTEANYLEDFVNADRTVIGATRDEALHRLVTLYKGRFPKIPIFTTDPTTAEMVKYVSNCFLATKVIFANEMYDICQKLGIKYAEVKKMVTADRRIEDSHLDVTSLRGFGGKCLPKDLLALRAVIRGKGVDTTLLDAVWKKNLRIRRVRDWEKIPFVVTRLRKKPRKEF